MIPPKLPDHEEADCDEPAEECRERHGTAPAAVRALDRAEDDRRQAEDGDERSDRIDAELAPLKGRLNVLEEEIAWRSQPRFTGGAP